jgi:DNA-directed RNA polymerase specialized sigma24 family protein
VRHLVALRFSAFNAPPVELAGRGIAQRGGQTADGRRILEAIENLPEDEREVFGLMCIQGMTQTEAAAHSASPRYP